MVKNPLFTIFKNLKSVPLTNKKNIFQFIFLFLDQVEQTQQVCSTLDKISNIISWHCPFKLLHIIITFLFQCGNPAKFNKFNKQINFKSPDKSPGSRSFLGGNPAKFNKFKKYNSFL